MLPFSNPYEFAIWLYQNELFNLVRGAIVAAFLTVPAYFGLKGIDLIKEKTKKATIIASIFGFFFIALVAFDFSSGHRLRCNILEVKYTKVAPPNATLIPMVIVARVTNTGSSNTSISEMFIDYTINGVKSNAEQYALPRELPITMGGSTMVYHDYDAFYKKMGDVIVPGASITGLIGVMIPASQTTGIAYGETTVELKVVGVFNEQAEGKDDMRKGIQDKPMIFPGISPDVK